MRERLDQFLRAVMAGIMICVGAIIYLSCEDKVMGAFLFAVGLLTILVFKLNLYTGKVGYILSNKPGYLIEVLITWLGNFAGTFLAAILICNTRIFAKLEAVNSIVDVKLSDNLLSIFILSIFCGILMFIAVDTYNKKENLPVGAIAVFVCVMTFILAGFEHSIANMAYISIAGKWSLNSLLYLVVMSAGNLVGGITIPAVLKVKKDK